MKPDPMMPIPTVSTSLSSPMRAIPSSVHAPP
jgi:hypothetical protein